MDNKKGAFIATSHLIERGCKNIAFISGSAHICDNWERGMGYDYALHKHKLLINPPLRAHLNDEKISSAANHIEYLLEQQISFDGIFTTSDFFTIGALQALNKNSIKIPEDVKLIGFSFNLAETSDLITPMISTVTQQQKIIGEKCVELLESMMNNGKKRRLSIKHMVLTPELIIRETS